MPELPEVECLTRSVRGILEGHQISDVKFYRRDLRGEIPVEQFQSDIIGHKVQRVYRRSKYLLVEVEKAIGIFHLGMSGQMICLTRHEPEFQHTHAVFKIKSDRPSDQTLYLHYIDPRRFGWISCCRKEEFADHPFFRQLGPEPLETSDLSDYLWTKSRGRSVAIKNFLMDAHVVVGVGNIYANEALFRAGIRPERPASKVRKREFSLLAPAICETLADAIQAGGTTFRDFKNADGNPGYFAVSLNVYGRQGEPCHQCGGVIQLTRLGGRATYYCRECQT